MKNKIVIRNREWYINNQLKPRFATIKNERSKYRYVDEWEIIQEIIDVIDVVKNESVDNLLFDKEKK